MAVNGSERLSTALGIIRICELFPALSDRCKSLSEDLQREVSNLKPADGIPPQAEDLHNELMRDVQSVKTAVRILQSVPDPDVRGVLAGVMLGEVDLNSIRRNGITARFGVLAYLLSHEEEIAENYSHITEEDNAEKP